ncbi:MAG: hypothetical protein UY96_C0038G0002 [Parcubacteria group bacterium GW2011_GWB1_56_8]|nr:MAG: hypothetical protein UY96_C0038G0002 [Parcubacteria group bacterium GW2011_GWB1_56_8]
MSEIKQQVKTLREERKGLVARLKALRVEIKTAREALQAEAPAKAKRCGSVAPRIQAVFGFGAFTSSELVARGIYEKRTSANVVACNGVKNGTMIRIQRGVYKLAGDPSVATPAAAPEVAAPEVAPASAATTEAVAAL